MVFPGVLKISVLVYCMISHFFAYLEGEEAEDSSGSEEEVEENGVMVKRKKKKRRS